MLQPAKRRLGCAFALLLAVAAGCSEPPRESAESGTEAPGRVVLPPRAAGFDYQIGGPYPPAAGVGVVSRDVTAPPAAGLYNICYVNAFQAQPGAEGDWDAGLLLRDSGGEVVMDKEWHEALLDLRSAGTRGRVMAKVGGWLDECAAKGYRAVELDNYDSYSRSEGLLSTADAEEFMRLLSAHAHAAGLAAGQKNASELANRKTATGVDFAVSEECGEQDNCAEFTEQFGDDVLVVEYTGEGLAAACAKWAGKLSIVLRDRNVVTPPAPGYVRKTC